MTLSVSCIVTTQEDCLTASDKAIELDVALGSNTVQYRETQGEESDKFLSYFKPCIIPIQGSLSSHMRIYGDKSKDTTMFRCEGEHVARVTEVRISISKFSDIFGVCWCKITNAILMLPQVPFSRSSLDHKAVFVVDTESKIFLFSGCNSSMQTRAKALDVVKHLKENRHCGRCEIATIGTGTIYNCFFHKHR